MSTLQAAVWIVQGGTVKQTTLADLMYLVETTPRPDGIGTKRYARENDDGWATYAYFGRERLLHQFASEEEAIAAVEEIWIGEIFNNNQIDVYLTEREALEVLADMESEL